MTEAQLPPDEGGPPARSMLRVLFDPLYGPFFLGKLLASSGMWINNVVAAIVAFQLTHSALVVGLISIAQFVPQTLLAPLSGALADRGDRRRQLIVGRIIAASGSILLGGWILLVGVNGLPGIAPVLGATLIAGIGYTIGHPAMHSLVPALVRPQELATAIALSSMPFTVARAIGPAIGALVASTAGPGYAFLAAAAGNLAFAVLLIPLKVGGRESREGKAKVTVRAGLAYVRRHADIMLLLLGVVAISFGADPVLTLTPAIAAETGAGSGGVGMMVSCFGIGAALALFFIRPLQNAVGIGRAATIGLMLMVVGNLGAAASFSLVTAALSFGVAGVGMSVALPSFSTQIQQRVSDEFRGRVMALWIVAFQGTRPLAALMSGGLADAFSTQVALCTAAAVVSAVAWLCRPARIG